jgi:hypothetical protein
MFNVLYGPSLFGKRYPLMLCTSQAIWSDEHKLHDPRQEKLKADTRAGRLMENVRR